MNLLWYFDGGQAQGGEDQTKWIFFFFQQATETCSLSKGRKGMGTDWKAAAWNLEGGEVYSVLSAPRPADAVTQNLTGVQPPS